MPSIELEGGASQVLCTGARASKQVLSFCFVMISVLMPLAIGYVQERASKLSFLKARGVEQSITHVEYSSLMAALSGWALSTICWCLLSIWHCL
jgi:hypothetical protein